MLLAGVMVEGKTVSLSGFLFMLLRGMIVMLLVGVMLEDQTLDDFRWFCRGV